MMRRTALLLLAGAALAAPAVADPLADGFANPPMSARPRVWWHWLNGNITPDGIAKDLAWMKRAGLGGVQNFDAALQTPQIVDKRLAYMTPEWQAAFKGAVSQADRLGLEFAIAASPGWSETGGPWVPPADGMKKLVWSETDVTGGRRFAGTLAPPPSATGPFQSVPFDDPLARFEKRAGDRPRAHYYADVAVLAYPLPGAAALPAPVVTSAGTPLPAGPLADRRFDGSVEMARGTAERPATLDLSYAVPQTVRSATLFLPGASFMFGDPEYLPILEARVGAGWSRVAALPLAAVPTTVSFAPVTASAFRLVLGPNTAPKRVGVGAPVPGAAMQGLPGGPPSANIAVAEFRLDAAPRIDRFEAKAGFATVADYYALRQPGGAEPVGIDPARVIDLTGRMRPDGSLDWTPPAGRWRVLRLGYSLLGTTNHPASAEATGLEVDKYDGAAVRRYLDHYLGLYRGAVGSDMIGAKGIRALLTDSIEAGDANWTPRMIARFTALRGYDPTPWLPALTGAIVGSRARSDAFLYDFRRTLADLFEQEHHATVAAVAHENGLALYGEALEDSRPQLGDDMAMRRHADVPMAAMWTYPRDGAPRPTLLGDVRGAASVAHVYGKPIVAAESLTSAFAPWAFAPSDLRRIIDLELVNGINRAVIHTSVHQPVDDKVPGLSLMIFGQYFNRHETWAEMARPWIDYIARSSFLLQQGRPVADVAYFYGEEAPLTALTAQGPLADVPVRYGYDFVNADILANEMSVAGGDLITRGGARYRLLYLGGSSRRMTLATLRRIAALAQAGATIAGPAPVASPALGDDPAAFAAIVRRLWAGGGETKVGAGRVLAGTDVEAALIARGIAPDMDYAKPQADSQLLFLHRSLPEGELYFVSNRANRPQRIDARFRVTGRAAELWRADDASAVAASYRSEGGGTVVPLDMAAEESLFVLFRTAPAALARTIAAPVPSPALDLSSGWTVAFQPGRGAPATTRLATLAPLETQADPGIRYFSGTASYTRRFAVQQGAGTAGLMLDLGKVGDVAEVRVNGRPAGTVWHAPYRLDIGPLVRRGTNRIEIKVANLWVNRLIGDAQPGATKITYTTLPTYRADAPLRPSGLIGPVTLTGVAAR